VLSADDLARQRQAARDGAGTSASRRGGFMRSGSSLAVAEIAAVDQWGPACCDRATVFGQSPVTIRTIVETGGIAGVP
jgi:hypothetical protein